jgi:hypothetical protein
VTFQNDPAGSNRSRAGLGRAGLRGPLSFAYTSLAIACAVIGGVGLITGRDRRSASTRLALGLMTIAFAITLQLVPLPRRALTSLSPATDTVLRQSDFSYLRPTNSAEPSDSLDPATEAHLDRSGENRAVGGRRG